MSPEIALLYDIWDKVKTYVSKKERLNVAEEIVRTFDDNIDINDVEEHLNQFDSVMKAAIVSHFDLISVDEDEDEEEWDY